MPNLAHSQSTVNQGRSIANLRVFFSKLAATVFIIISFVNLAICAQMPDEKQTSAKELRFADGTFKGWTVQGPQIWAISLNPSRYVQPDSPSRYVTSLGSGEEATGTLRSGVFTVTDEIQRFSLAGADGTATGTNNGHRNFLLLRSYPDGEILRKARPPGGTMKMQPMRWGSFDLVGRKVYLELVDDNPRLNPRGFAWMGFADYRQEPSPYLNNPVTRHDLFAVEIDSGATLTICRTLPFMAASPEKRGQTKRIFTANEERIPVGYSADVLYLLGMINEGWDCGVAHWKEHPELCSKRDDQIYIGSKIGQVEIRYADQTSDHIPLVIGATAWFFAHYAYGTAHGVTEAVSEPFASRVEYAKILSESLKIKQDEQVASHDSRHARYFLAVKPRSKVIESIIVQNNPNLRGRPLISAVTLAGARPAEGLKSFGTCRVDAADVRPTIKAANCGDWAAGLTALADALYTTEADLPKKVDLIDFPRTLDATRIRFLGGVKADMLSNIWVANLQQIAEKFPADTGFFHETGKRNPWYGGYSGIGTWVPAGIYSGGAFSRSSDHFATLALRCLYNPQRLTSYVDFCDKWFYFFRDNHDPNLGPPNAALDVSKYPPDAPGHWTYIMMRPMALPRPINELPSNEEMDGHGSTVVGRWVAWRMKGAPTGSWLTTLRDNVYGYSRWDTSRDAADFICWLMDYTAMDVIYSEGESTGWGKRTASGGLLLVPEGMVDETDLVKIRKNYANSDMYEPCPTYVCMTALRCSAQIADAIGNTQRAAKWRRYADRLQEGMIRLLAVGDHNFRTWKVSRCSIWPSHQDSLVQAWFSIYYDGLDPQRLHPEMTHITRNTLKHRQLSQPYGYKPVLAMGYGMGWITKAALILDEMDAAGKLLLNIARYSYDKNMNYVDEQRGIDWRRWLWIIPEGTNLLPDGRWYRIGDLSNAANQGPAMHALELCAGIDDTKPQDLKILPRVPDPLTGLEIENFFVLVPDNRGLATARVNYLYHKRPLRFSLTSDRLLPTLSLRLGPFDRNRAQSLAAGYKNAQSGTIRLESSGKYRNQDAWWIWIEGMVNLSSLEIENKKGLCITAVPALR